MKCLTGKQIVNLMSKHKKTIAGMSSEWEITKKRIREVRENGIQGTDFIINEWIYLITNQWPEQE